MADHDDSSGQAIDRTIPIGYQRMTGVGALVAA